ncbi:MAG: hypothetical protein ABI818_10025, partial [Acidobacteriota bacterium]
DVAETLAAVLRADIDVSRFPASTPVALTQLVRRCLDRDVTRRLRDIGEARIALDDLSREAPLVGFGRPRRQPRWRLPIAVTAAAIVAAAATSIILWPVAPATSPPATRFVLSTPVDQTLLVDPQSRDLAIAPDGTRVVYKGGPRVDRTQLFTYSLDQLTPEPLTGPGLPKGPFTSPDGHWVAFFEPGPAGVLLKKVAMTGGPPIDVSQLDGPSRGASWGDDGMIIAASAAPDTGLLRIPAAGGGATVLTRPNREAGEADHLFPQVLPGSHTVLYTITALGRDLSAAQVAALDITTGQSKTLVRGASQAYYVSSGHLVYFAGGALWGIGFDPRRLETVGTARVLVPQVVTLPTGVAEFDIARDGTLVYVARVGSREALRTLAWVNRKGQETGIQAPPRRYSTLRLSPDGTRVALEIEDDDNDIWVWDFAREALARVTRNPGLDQSPIWMPDGRRLVFSSQAGGALGSLFLQAADGSGVAERLTESRAIQRASQVLPDGSAVLFSDRSGMQMLTLDGARRTAPMMPSPPAASSGAISPDRRWLAYVVEDSGSAPQVFVSPFFHPESERTLVSRDGGVQPRWSPDGRELFFIGFDGTLMHAAVRVGSALSVGVPTRLLPRPYYNGFSLVERPATYDVSPDGRRFLMLKQITSGAEPSRPATVIVVKQWMEELRRLVPPPR